MIDRGMLGHTVQYNTWPYAQFQFSVSLINTGGRMPRHAGEHN